MNLTGENVISLLQIFVYVLIAILSALIGYLFKRIGNLEEKHSKTDIQEAKLEIKLDDYENACNSCKKNYDQRFVSIESWLKEISSDIKMLLKK